jgi:hypothetical protein
LSEIWADLVQFEFPTAWPPWLSEQLAVAVLLVVVLATALAWYLGWQQKRRRTHRMLVAVNDAAFGRCLPRSKTGAWGFAVSVEPPPEHFREFNISYQPVSILHPLDFLRRTLGRQKSTLQISGVLLDAPTAEIVWVRGQPPMRALGVSPGRSPWVQSRLDYVGMDYATRGTNVAALRHLFQDMIARFAPILHSLTIQRERRPHVRMVAQGRIDARDVSPLITIARSLGRAAMMR